MEAEAHPQLHWFSPSGQCSQETDIALLHWLQPPAVAVGTWLKPTQTGQTTCKDDFHQLAQMFIVCACLEGAQTFQLGKLTRKYTKTKSTFNVKTICIPFSLRRPLPQVKHLN